mmetsp:Transcript_5082/g.5875  ORF Transcript_5082/g.5875 Transcript_5082/m.5875 type:complete len:278 (-) Transcript_5082:103-936(-)|eukprot:CAMPEP_0184028224 /NCGR_PEP_ID=MMETSP0954-20121128/14687_1 /TAXON_ID=627963 /ORGANISM="Aplanochytrium sp, Strain PBS07" /LENGTH=277 /DNA_ID=CAMNT_0026312975 /DNA_START=298 /DNA_END=1131 /DNA_ORIENTATION=+
MSVVVNVEERDVAAQQSRDAEGLKEKLRLEQETEPCVNKMRQPSHSSLVFLAKVSERAKRFDDMREYVRQIVYLTPDLTSEERNLLAVAYKNSLTMRRHSWQLILKKSRVERGSIEQAGLDHFKELVRREIENICFDIMDLIKNKLLVYSQEEKIDEATVFYLKLMGDYNRYLTELDVSGSQGENRKNVVKYYEEAFELGMSVLKPTDVNLLGLVLNMSVFFYDILNKPDKACLLANRAYDDAISHVDALPAAEQDEANLLLSFLRKNLELWTSNEN